MKARYLHLRQGGRTGSSEHLAECEEDYWATSIITKSVTWRRFYWALKNRARARGSDRVYDWAMTTDMHHPSSNETRGSRFILSNNRWPSSRMANHLQQNHNWLGSVSDCSFCIIRGDLGTNYPKRIITWEIPHVGNQSLNMWCVLAFLSVLRVVLEGEPWAGPYHSSGIYRVCRELFENPKIASIQSLNVVRFIKFGHKGNILIMSFLWTHTIEQAANASRPEHKKVSCVGSWQAAAGI